MTADLVLLNALNVWQWLALAGSSAVVCATAVYTHRRDRQRR